MKTRASIGELVRGPGATLADQAVVSLANFLTVFLLARGLTPQDFGLVALLLASLLMVTAIQTSLVGHVHNVLGPRRKRTRFLSLTGHLLLVQMGFGLLVTLTALAVVPFGEFALGAGGRDLAVAFAAIVFPWMLQDASRRIFYTDRKASWALLNDVLCYGTQTVGALALGFGYLDATISNVGLIYAAACAAGALTGVVQLACLGVTVHLAELRADLQEAWKISRFLTAGEFISTGAQYMFNWLIIGFAGLPVLGAYRALIHLVNVANPLEQALFLYLPPRAADYFGRHGADAYSAWFLRIAGVVVVVAAGLLGVLAVFADPLITLAYGTAYAGFAAAGFVVIACLARVVRIAGSVLKSGLVSTGDSSIVVRDAALRIVLLAVLTPILLNYFGLVGIGLVLLGSAIPLTSYAFSVFLGIGRRNRGTAARTEVPLPGSELIDGGCFADLYRIPDGRVVKQYVDSSAPLRFMARNEAEVLGRLDRAAKRRPAGVAIPRPYPKVSRGPQVVMEHAPGRQLHRWVQDEALSEEAVAVVAERLHDGVRHVHQELQEPYHDLTPLNLLWDDHQRTLWMIDLAGPGPRIPPPKGMPLELVTAGNYLGWLAYQHARPFGRLSGRALGVHGEILSRFLHLLEEGRAIDDRQLMQACWWRYAELTETSGMRAIWFRHPGRMIALPAMRSWLVHHRRS
ncbi:MAG: hypothetical protein JJ896_07870 [Rhodothermales bacterium]|nr:hypothetical protein [Rhodothermales bacterium]MBO6779557.1 hypothetical protein [Rhodothermales bacterium]